MITNMKFKILLIALVLTTLSACVKTTNSYSIIGSWEITITTQDSQVYNVIRVFDGTQYSGSLYGSTESDPIGQYRLDNLGITFSTSWTDAALHIQVSNRYKGKFTSQDTMEGTLNQVYTNKDIPATWTARRL